MPVRRSIASGSRAASQARLLDFPAPGPGTVPRPVPPVRSRTRSASSRSGGVRRSAPDPGDRRMRPADGPLPPGTGHPRHARAQRLPSLASAAERAAALTEGLDHITRPRRAASIVLANVPLVRPARTVDRTPHGRPTAGDPVPGDEQGAGGDPDARREGRTQESVRAREALEIYAADRFRAGIADERTWHDPRSAGLLTPLRPTARASSHLGGPSPMTTAARHMPRRRPAREPGLDQEAGRQDRRRAAGGRLLVSAVAAVLSAFSFRGGLLLRLARPRRGTARAASEVRGSGRRGARSWPGARSCCSGSTWAAWSAAGATCSMRSRNWWWAPAAAAAAAAAGCAWAIRNPARGAAERLTGTCLVPR